MKSSADELYADQVRPLTDEDKLRLVELIAHELASRNGGPSNGRPTDDASRHSARERFRRHAGAVRLGHPTGADNTAIDADLAREHGTGLEPI